MTKKDNIHPVVKLLAARMESHPDEFWYPETHQEVRTVTGIGRWDFTLGEVRKWANPEELKLLSHGPLDSLHRTALDELCLLYTSPSPRDRQRSRMPSSA